MAGRLLAAIILALSLNCAAWGQAGVLKPAPQPQWSQLNAQQRTALAPLAREWNKLPDSRKLKWLGIARRFATLSDTEQARTQDRMREWLTLSPSQRELARIQYKQLLSVSPEQRRDLEQKWQQYQALSDAEKTRLRGGPQAIARSPALTPVPAASAPTSQRTTQIRPPKALTLNLPAGRTRPGSAQSTASAPVAIPVVVPPPPPEEEIERE